MKKSLISRWAIIIVIIAVWAASIFPYRDQPFLEVMRDTAQPSLIDNRFETLLKDAAAEIEASRDESGNTSLPARDVVKRLASKAEPPIILSDYIQIYEQQGASNKTVLQFISRKASGKLKKGIDLAGGTEFVIGFENLPESEERTAVAVRDEIVEIIRNRIDRVGVTEPVIKPIGERTISVTVPAVKPAEVAEYRKLLTRVAKLEFRLVHAQNLELIENYGNSDFVVPAGFKLMDMITEENNQETVTKLLISREKTGVSGTDLNTAEPTIDQFGQFKVNLAFDATGSVAFCELTTDNVGRLLAIVLDGTVFSAPVLNEPICGGRAEISGSFTADEAKQLAVVLQCGNLPVDIDLQGEFTTSATLGADSVKSGTSAALWGLLFVFVFMVIYYFFAGIIADIALAANIVLVLGTLTIAGATITLPGIAGIVLTIGMAVDANVLIFERIREELINNKSVGNAVRLGYERAFSTIFDANITTLLTAIILYNFGTGPVRGFAVTLAIGIVASLFTALFVTRAIFDLMLHNKWISDVKMVRLLSKTDIDFVGMRRLAAIVSAILLLVSIAVFIGRGADKYSVDFTGGMEISYKYEKQIPAAQLRSALEEDFNNARVSYKASMTDGGLLEVVVPEASERTNSESSESMDRDNIVTAVINKNFPDAKVEHVGTKQIGSLVGAKFRQQAIIAMFAAIIGIVLYISFRFEFGYALGAVAALTHDVMIGVGIFLLSGRQLSLPVIAALLTIIGYSLNDTIVVFDRIRENLDLKKGKFLDIVNVSLNNTLSRTLLTSVTTGIVVLMLLFFGGGAINDFALIMATGVIVGTYSSLFVATPVMILYHNWSIKRTAAAAAAAASSKPEVATSA
jgi:SecD/SecF fusion protein